MYANGETVGEYNDATYFDSFEIEKTPKEIKKFTGNRNITTKIFRIQAYYSIMCGYFCIRMIDFMLISKSLLEYTNLFSPKEMNDKIILKYFQ